MKRYHGVSPLEQKRSMPAWLAKPSFVIGLLIVLVVILMALFPQFIAPYDPIATDVTVSNQAPSAAHWFGTDFYGRDIFSRVIWGTRIDLLIGVLGVVIPFLVGGMIGLLAGYYGGFLDSLLMRITGWDAVETYMYMSVQSDVELNQACKPCEVQLSLRIGTPKLPGFPPLVG